LNSSLIERAQLSCECRLALNSGETAQAEDFSMRSKFIKVLSHAGFALALVGGSASAAESASWNVGSPAFGAQALTADLDVREGTWMNVDVSPDGQSLVFDLLGD
jgi:hypothetical protein